MNIIIIKMKSLLLVSILINFVFSESEKFPENTKVVQYTTSLFQMTKIGFEN